MGSTGSMAFFSCVQFSPLAGLLFYVAEVFTASGSQDHRRHAAASFGRTFPATQPIRRVPFSASDGGKVTAGRMRCAPLSRLSCSFYTRLLLSAGIRCPLFMGATFPRLPLFLSGYSTRIAAVPRSRGAGEGGRRPGEGCRGNHSVISGVTPASFPVVPAPLQFWSSCKAN